MTVPADLALLERLMSPEGDPQASAMALLADHDDPRLRLLAELWSHQEGAMEETEVPDPADPREELAGLRERNTVLAAALGACETCWGEEPACVICRGRGAPGGRAPDRALFAELVVPAIRRLKRSG